MTRSLLLLVMGLVVFTANGTASADDREQFFEAKIRPLLARRCFECHGEKKQESSVRLDHKSLVMGKTSQTALVDPGHIDKSRLWQVVKYDDNDIQMPPAAPLPAEEKELLKLWIEQGAFWPDEKDQPAPARGVPHRPDGNIDFVAAVQQHWAYRPLSSVSVPADESGACRTEIDCFVAADLKKAGLGFSAPASREILIRRLKIDLHGLPPTFAETQAFVNDSDPHALEKLVDELLASPLYGQRWARHWLDVARYADTKGYVFAENRYYPFAYTYRDYVIQALNNDTPYDDFIREQLAADQMGFSGDDPRLAALGFLTVGPRFLNREPDIIDDRIDVVTRGLMGMTVGCARCHDHKYDPIPTKDYYALYGVFQSSYEPEQGPLIEQVDQENPRTKAFLAERSKREAAIAEFVRKSQDELLQKLIDQMDDLIPAAAQAMKLIDKKTDLQPRHGVPRAKLISRWQDHLKSRINAKDPVFLAWDMLMSVPADQLTGADSPAVVKVLADPNVPAPFKFALQSHPPQSRLDVTKLYAQVLQEVAEKWKEARQQTPAPEALANVQLELIRKTLYGPGSLTDLPAQENSPLFERDQFEHLRKLRSAVNDWDATSPDAPARAMVMLDKDQPVQPVVFVRGNPGRRGETVKRHAPRILDPQAETPFAQGSGRKELAERIVAEDNPLTARVIVNRVWSWHFQSGLVETASDFGSRSEEPTHPELLDYLAWSFIHQDHWSLKSLHRRILLSQVYLQESDDRPEARQIDPENRLLWRQNRQRMDFETMRDAMMQVSGELHHELDGRPFNIEKEPATPRRTIYAEIDRNNLPGLLRTFDYPSPDASSPGRPLTTVPQQALYALNSPFVQQVSQRIADRIRQQASAPAEQAKLALQIVYGRAPRDEELSVLTRHLETHPLEQLTQTLVMTNEFLFVD